MNNELQEWEARGMALENGDEWNESHRLVGYANSVSADKAKELVESGVYRRCGQCSHPHQSIYHLTSAEGVPRERSGETCGSPPNQRRSYS